MASPISYPLSTPQVQAAERVQSQVHHNPAASQQAAEHEAERMHLERLETVQEVSETENPRVDEEGHQGAEYEGSERSDQEAEEEADKEKSRTSKRRGDEDDLQGRFINVVI